ncbi:YciI family protein [Sorangium sp. So ce260]|uniref:YciI family protein n=1 Tax=Sorangium sp. So ce260 TaxID=3133291 RepID=UPI003F60E8D6
MKYIMMMHTPQGGPYQVAAWPQKDFLAHIDFMKRFHKQLSESGELVAAEGLAGPEQARLVRAGKDGKPVTDGVFPETKEFLAGYWIVEVDSAERAYELAAQASAAPGPGGAPLNLAIEVREVMSAPPPQELP